MQHDLFRFCDLIKQKFYYLVNLGTFYGACDRRYKQGRFPVSFVQKLDFKITFDAEKVRYLCQILLWFEKFDIYETSD